VQLQVHVHVHVQHPVSLSLHRIDCAQTQILIVEFWENVECLDVTWNGLM
jgi:hypothetical protein